MAANQTVTANASNTFSPHDVTITQGESVTWHNDAGMHNVVLNDGSFTDPIGATDSRWTVSRTFNTAGTFSYFCAQHKAFGMTGTVTVLAPGGAPPPGGSPPPTGYPPGGSPPASGGPVHETATLSVSDSTPKHGRRVRFSGSVKPKRDGAIVLIQRRTRHGKYKTVAKVRLKHAGASRSVFSISLRISRDSVFRVRIPGDRSHATATSRTRHIEVH